MPDFAPIMSFQVSTGYTDLPLPRLFNPPSASGVGSYEVPRPFSDSFTEFESYEMPNWDGNDAAPITKETISGARRFNLSLPRELPPADLAPGADGTIGLEWRHGPPESRRFVIVEIGPGDLVVAKKIAENGAVSKLAPIRARDSRAIENLLSMLFTGRDVSSE